MKNLPFSSLSRVFSILFMAFLASCSSRHYAPNQLNIPGFREKGEAKAAASHGNGFDFSGVDAQAAWAPIKHVSVAGDFLYGRASRNQKPGGWGQGHHANLALGTFWKVGQRGSLEGSYGIGAGRVENWTRRDDGSDFVRSYQFYRGTGQVAYTARMRSFELSFGTRVVGLQHFNRKDDAATIPGKIGWDYVLEPGAVLAMGGGERFKLTVSFCRGYLLQPDEETILEIANFNLGVGVQYRLGKLAKLPKAEPRPVKAVETPETIEIAPEKDEKGPKTETVAQVPTARRDDHSLDSARVLLKSYLKTGETTDAPGNLEKMRSHLAAIELQPGRSDVSLLVDIWLLYRPEGFDSKAATEKTLFLFADEASDAITRKLKTARYTAFEIAELKGLRKRLRE